MKGRAAPVLGAPSQRPATVKRRREARATPKGAVLAPVGLEGTYSATTSGTLAAVAVTLVATACSAAADLAWAPGRASAAGIAISASTRGPTCIYNGATQLVNGSSNHPTTQADASPSYTGPSAAIRPFDMVADAPATVAAGDAPSCPLLPVPFATSIFIPIGCAFMSCAHEQPQLYTCCNACPLCHVADVIAFHTIYVVISSNVYT